MSYKREGKKKRVGVWEWPLVELEVVSSVQIGKSGRC